MRFTRARYLPGRRRWLKVRPGIFNTNQGAQFTGEVFTGLLERHGVRISMDGKGRYSGNLFIERLWRTVKYEVYLKAYQDGTDARAGTGDYFRSYNTERPHQALSVQRTPWSEGYLTPAKVFTSIPVETTHEALVKSLVPGPLRTAGPALIWPLSCPNDGVHLKGLAAILSRLKEIASGIE